MNQVFQKPSILIIDDEKDICFLLSSILQQREMRTRFASNLSEAGDIIGDCDDFSFVFIDNHLPDGLGVDFIARIRQRCPDCKIIMITAHDTAPDRQRAVSAGVDYFIGKPFTRESILTTIDRLSA